MKSHLANLSLVIVLCLVLGGIFTKRQFEVEDEKFTYRTLERQKFEGLAKSVEQKIQLMYQAIRTISFLPGVRGIDRYGKKMDSNTKMAIQQIYNNAYVNIKLSELYLLPASLDPDAKDLVTGKNQEPIITFDEFITSTQAKAPEEGSKVEEEKKPELEEVEIEEYRLMKRQLEYFSKNVASTSSFKDLEVPAMSGPVVITCDNSDFKAEDLAKGNNEPRNGLVYTVPFFGQDGKYKGGVSAVVRTRVLESYLEEGNTALVNDNYGVSISKNPTADLLNFGKKASHIFEDTLEMNLPDGPGWKIKVSLPDSDFYQSKVYLTGQRTYVMTMLAVIIIGILLIIYRMRNRKTMNFLQVATHSLLDRAGGLTESSDRVASQARSLDQISQATTAAIHQTASAAEEMLRMMETNSEKIENTKSSVERGQGHIVDSMDSVSRLNDAIVQISESRAGLQKISGIFDSIAKKIGVINSIVMETRLLSFNASIEAARAGRYGKGFSVVAEEVGKLASLSGSAAEEINHLLANSSQQIENVVKDISQSISRGQEVFTEMQGGLEKIDQGFSEINKAVESVNGSTSQQMEAVKQVTAAIQGIEKNSNESITLSAELKKESTSLMEASESLNDNVIEIQRFFKA